MAQKFNESSMRSAFLIILIMIFSCKGYRTENFSYTDSKGASQSIKVVVPSGVKRSETKVDSAGNTIMNFIYKNSTYYVAHVKDTGTQIIPIVYGLNIPRRFVPNGAITYKGLDPLDRYWREVRRGDNLRFGYNQVMVDDVFRFDSAANYGMITEFK